MRGYLFYTWFSRIGGLIFLLLYGLFIFGEGAPEKAQGMGKEWMEFLPFILPAVAGYLIAWFRPYAGGLLMTGGGIVLAVFFLWRNDIGMSIVFGLPALMIGLSFVTAARRRLI